MSAYSIPAVNDRFDMLRQLGNLFIVQPNVLKSYMAESHLGRVDIRYLRPYLAQRSDYSQFSRSLNLDDGMPEEPAHSVVGHMNNLFSHNSRGNRMSVMSGVAGAGMGRLKEMLKEFEALSPEEAATAAKRERERDTSMARQRAAMGMAEGGAAAGRPKFNTTFQQSPMFFGI
jgi:hypothetical protein